MKYKSNKYLDVPHGNFSVWRYMAHWKLEKLLEDSQLYFPNATKLSDAYEITIPESTQRIKQKELKNEGYYGEKLKEKLAQFHWETNSAKDSVFLNCWSINPHESYALWKIYLGSDKDGIAIKSTVSSLRKSLQMGGDSFLKEFYLSRVRYSTHIKPDELNRWSVITTKKPYYDFEKELRLFILNHSFSDSRTKQQNKIPDGREVKVDLQAMIQNIYISPFATNNYTKKVKQLLKNSHFKTSVLRQSQIMDE